MRMFVDVAAVYLHREPVDFRKAINGLATIVENDMGLSPFLDAVFVFRNRRLDKLKILYWNCSGFCLWQTRLEEERFKWPKGDATISLTEAQLQWLLSGYDINRMIPHKTLNYQCVN